MNISDPLAIQSVNVMKRLDLINRRSRAPIIYHQVNYLNKLCFEWYNFDSTRWLQIKVVLCFSWKLELTTKIRENLRSRPLIHQCKWSELYLILEFEFDLLTIIFDLALSFLALFYEIFILILIAQRKIHPRVFAKLKKCYLYGFHGFRANN